MKIYLALLSIVFLFSACQETIEKPENLIEEPVMVDIIYDLALLEGIKANNSLLQQNLNSDSFVYKKYNIDSLQFVKSSQYYATDMAKFKKMYEKVSKRIEENKSRLDSDKGRKDKSVQ